MFWSSLEEAWVGKEFQSNLETFIFDRYIAEGGSCSFTPRIREQVEMSTEGVWTLICFQFRGIHQSLYGGCLPSYSINSIVSWLDICIDLGVGVLGLLNF